MRVTTTADRRTFQEILEREHRYAVSLLRAFPSERIDDVSPDCRRSARDLAREHLNGYGHLQYLLQGRSLEMGVPERTSFHEIVARLWAVHAEMRDAIATIDGEGWNEPLRGPTGVDGIRWETGRRAELAWMMLKDLSRHAAHLAIHLRQAREPDPAQEPASLAG